MVNHPNRSRVAPLRRLINIAKSDTGQSRRVANFLMAWWNATELGGFDFTDFWNVDEAIVKDMFSVMTLIASTQCYPDSLDPAFKADFADIVTRWRLTGEAA